eukprot:131245_1
MSDLDSDSDTKDASNPSEDDTLKLAINLEAQTMLARHGINRPMPERVMFSAVVNKINRKGKSQKRVLIITDKAVYNVKPNKYKDLKRRVSLDSIQTMSASSSSGEFVIHIPSEYDYHFQSDKCVRICKIIRTCAKKKNTKIEMTVFEKESLADLVTKKK